MKQFLLLIAALSGAARLLAAPETPVIAYPEYSVRGTDGGIVIHDYENEPLLKIGTLNFSWAPPIAVPTAIEKNANDSLRISYRIDRDDSGEIKLDGVLKVTPDGRIRIDWKLDAPETVNVGGIMLELLPRNATTKSKDVYKSGLWTRHDRGGIPFEINDGYFRCFKNGNLALWMLLGGNSAYSNPWSEHLNFSRGEDGRHHASLELQISSPDLEGYAASALFHRRPLGMRLVTDKPFNLWESGSPEVRVEIANPYDRARSAAFEITGRDFDGNIVLNEKKNLSLNPYETRELRFRLPAAERAIYFVEARLLPEGEKEIFCRTNLGILPPHQFEHLNESPFALASYFPIPSEEAVFQLMRRLGVRLLRHGDNRVSEQYEIISMLQDGVLPEESTPDAAEKLAAMIRRAREQRNPALEFCNEWNMGITTAADKRRMAAHYVELLRLLRDLRDRQYPELQIIGMGMAGADTEFLKFMAEYGAVPLMDGGVALHPGRGNMTPDYEGGGWTYLGAIRRWRETMNELGIKTLHLSEVYASTRPNDWWRDSYRQAAENVILTYAIGLAEGAKSIQFYQLHDSVWYDQGGVNHLDGEYHYGLLMRDGTLKPSLLAYAAIAEALDGARFTGYLDFGDRVHGITFRTPRGPLAIVYDRTDGFFLSEKSDDFAGTEPWIDTWKTHRKITFQTTGHEVITIDPIGRTRTVGATDGRVTLELSGAPLMVYGLKFQGGKQ